MIFQACSRCLGAKAEPFLLETTLHAASMGRCSLPSAPSLVLTLIEAQATAEPVYLAWSSPPQCMEMARQAQKRTLPVVRGLKG